jgi:copper oxidase (laccase) domain-containing protein
MRAEFSTKPENLVAAIGPAAVCKYEIGQDVIDAFGKSFPDSTHLFTPTCDSYAFVDLHKANFEQLLSVGVLPENVYVAPLCTMERTDLFFSYRKEKKIYGKTGRMLSVVGRKE